jgi:hypothetical protein
MASNYTHPDLCSQVPRITGMSHCAQLAVHFIMHETYLEFCLDIRTQNVSIIMRIAIQSSTLYIINKKEFFF